MAHEQGVRLDTGDLFPSMEIFAVDGSTIRLPDDFRRTWNVMLFYRGHW